MDSGEGDNPVEENPAAPGEEDNPVEIPIHQVCAKELNDHLHRPDESVDIGGSIFNEIILHEWKLGQSHFQVRWSDGSTTIESLKGMREDYPRITAQYIVKNNVSRSNRGGDRVLQWAKQVVRDLN